MPGSDRAAPPGGVRVDKWLWAARFFKTRRLAADAVKGGKVSIDGVTARPAKEVRPGQTLLVTKGPYQFEVVVEGLADTRGPASIAETLYHETEASAARREQIRSQRRSIAVSVPRADHRPDRRDRRELAAFKRNRGGD